MKCIVLGGSGEVGRAVVKEFIKCSACTQITLLGRRSVAEFAGEPKVQQVVTDTNALDFEECATKYAEGHDVAVCCIGIGSGTGSMPEEELLKVEVELVGKFARGCKASGIEAFELLTAYGVNEKSSRSKIKYIRVLGKKLDAVLSVGFEKVAVFKPGIIVGNAHTPRWMTPITGLIPDALGLGNIDQMDLAKAFVAHLERRLPLQQAAVVFYENKAMKDLIR